jgi:hypothetical protein
LSREAEVLWTAERLLRPGASLVLALGAASAGVTAAADRAARLVNSLGADDWELASRWARGLRAEGVLCRALPADAPAATSLRQRWGQLAMVADFRQERLRESLTEALRALNAAGIPTLLFKGAALASFAYPGFPDRPMEDVDVLVPPEDAERAFDVLQREMWTSSRKARDAGSHHHLPQLRHRQTGAILELHRSLLPSGHPFRWDDGASWGSAERVVQGGVETRRLSLEELLLHGALHFAWSHELRVGAWGWMRDLAVLRRLVDGDVVWRMAEERGAEAALWWALRVGGLLAGEDQEADGVARPARGRVKRGWCTAPLERHLVMDAVPGSETPGSELIRRRLRELALRPPAARDRGDQADSGAVATVSREAGHGAQVPEAGRARISAAALLRAVLREAGRAGSWMRWVRRLVG